MYAEIIVKYLHFIFIFVVVSCVVAEHLLLKPQMTKAEIKRLSTIDGIYGLASILVVAAGLTLWFGIGKPKSLSAHAGLFLALGHRRPGNSLLDCWFEPESRQKKAGLFRKK